MPRLELRWERIDEFNTRCVYALVRRNLDDDIVAKPLGQTTVQGSSQRDFWHEGWLHMPVRDGAQAQNDAQQLGLPLYITTTDGDAVRWSYGIQSVVRRASRPAAPNRAGAS